MREMIAWLPLVLLFVFWRQPMALVTLLLVAWLPLVFMFVLLSP